MRRVARTDSSSPPDSLSISGSSSSSCALHLTDCPLRQAEMFSIQPHYCSPPFQPSSSPPSPPPSLPLIPSPSLEKWPHKACFLIAAQPMFDRPECRLSFVKWMSPLWVGLWLVHKSMLFSECVAEHRSEENENPSGAELSIRGRRIGQWGGRVPFFLSPAFKCSSWSPRSFCFTFVKADNRVSLLHVYIRWMRWPIKPNPLTDNKDIPHTYKSHSLFLCSALYVHCMVINDSSTMWPHNVKCILLCLVGKHWSVSYPTISHISTIARLVFTMGWPGKTLSLYWAGNLGWNKMPIHFHRKWHNVAMAWIHSSEIVCSLASSKKSHR